MKQLTLRLPDDLYKEVKLNIDTSVTNLDEIKELLEQVATLSVSSVNINVTYLPQTDLSSLGEQLRNSHNAEKQYEH